MIKKLTENKLLRIAAICLSAVFILGALGTACVLGVDAFVVLSTRDRVISTSEAGTIDEVDCIIVLGCKVQSDGTPSHMLNDRLVVGTDVYYALCENGKGSKLLMSGDHGREEYNEVAAMKSFAIGKGIDSGEIFMDHAGFSTYESIWRVKEIFGAKKIIIVTQKYHLYRALHIADALGVEAYGVSADLRSYTGRLKFSAREILARNKDFLTAITKPEPTYKGEPISLQGSGDVTND
jgi:vancomycin permeability regulator SanA